VRAIPFFKNIVSNYERAIPFAVPADYAYGKQTAENYLSPGYKGDKTDADGQPSVWMGIRYSTTKAYDPAKHGPLRGEFAAIRAGLDYSYHPNSNVERQGWQDQLVNNVVTRTAPQARPWVVFTCGPMGAGKGYVMKWCDRARPPRRLVEALSAVRRQAGALTGGAVPTWTRVI
jgi:hypothetical protein